MRTATVMAIVEGHGETQALPILLRRIAALTEPTLSLRIPKPIRRGRDRLLLEGELEKDVALAAEKYENNGVILILLDSEGECPARLGPQVLARATKAREDRKIFVAIAHQEYEAWFLAAAASLSGKRGLAENLIAPEDPESIQGAKEWLREHMPATRRYSETVDQAACHKCLILIAPGKRNRSTASFECAKRCFKRCVRSDGVCGNRCLCRFDGDCEACGQMKKWRVNHVFRFRRRRTG